MKEALALFEIIVAIGVVSLLIASISRIFGINEKLDRRMGGKEK